jgi:hypothetical protein
MRAETIEAIKQFATAVELLAQGTIHMIGVDACTSIMTVAERLKDELDKEPTP